MTIVLADPSDSALYSLSWDGLPNAVTIGTVVHTAPNPLTKVSESTNAGTATSTVKVSGAIHGGMYMIEAQTTLSNGEVLNRQFPLRCFNG